MVGVYLREAGRAAATRAAPLYFGIAVVCAILFGGNGMDAADAVRSLATFVPLRVGLWAAWLLATAPVARLLVDAPTTFWLRSLPGARAGVLAAVAIGLAAVEAPWVVLFARGAGPVAGAAALLCAAAAHASLIGGPPLLAALIVAAVALGAPAWALVAVGAAAGMVAVPAAVRAAPERAARPQVPLVKGPAPVALALAYLASAWRAAPAAASRAVIVAAAGGALAALLSRNTGQSLQLAVGAPMLVLASGGLVDAILAAEREAGWLLTASGAASSARAAGRAGAAAAVGAGAGAVFAALASAPLAPAWGALLSGVLVERRRRAPDGGRALVATLAVAAAGALVGWWLR
jgi:hypothetical protein